MERRDLPSFVAPVSYDTGGRPFSVAVGDFNGDGIPDLVTADSDSNTVSVLLGNGDGSFQPARSFAVGIRPLSVAVGDFNGDGIPDLVTANANSGSVSVLVGNGDGTFQSARTLITGPAYAVAVGDFNGDGILDLAVSDEGNPGRVSVLRGNGDGTFQFPRTFAAGSYPGSVVVGDFNGDGIPDLAVADAGDSQGRGQGVSVLLGNGDGSFQAPVSYAAGRSPASLAVGDFNGDGIPDLAVANYYGGNVSVLLGKGDGSFQPSHTFAVGTEPTSVAVGDFNGDGIPDLAVTASDGVSVLLGNGNGSFQLARTFTTTTGFNYTSVAVGDFNGDGRSDLAVADTFNSSVSVLLGTGDGSFSPAPSYAAGGQIVAVGDFNGDGIPDLAVAYSPNLNRPGGVSVLLGNGDGTFQPPRSIDGFPPPPILFAPTSLVVGDFNDDGIPDLAVTNVGGGVFVALGNGDGSFQPARSFAAGCNPLSVAVGDFNGDGVPDLAVADGGDLQGNGQGVSLLLGNGDGSFQPPRTVAAGAFPDSVAVGDFNGDGTLDLVVADGGDLQGNGQGVSLLLGNGDGSFQAPRTFSAGTRPTSLVAGDFNGDGVPDLAVANAGTVEHQYRDGSVSVLLGKGDGTFQPTVTYAAGLGPAAVAVGDFNGDGIPDLVVANYYGGARVLLGNGDGSFQTSPVSYVGGQDSVSIAVGDFNSDGRADLALTTDALNPTVSILFNDGDWPAGPGSTPGRRANRSNAGAHAAARPVLATALIPNASALRHRSAVSITPESEPALPPSSVGSPSADITDTPATHALLGARYRPATRGASHWDPASADLGLLDQVHSGLVWEEC